MRYSWSDEANLPFNSFGNLASSAGGDGPSYTTTHSLSMDHNYIASPTLLLDVRYGLNYRHVDRKPISAGFDLAGLGFPSSVVQTAQAAEFPRIGVQSFQALGQNTFTDLIIRPTTHQFNLSGTKILTGHTFKFGMDYRKFLLNFLQLYFPSGQSQFRQRAMDAAQSECQQRDGRFRAGVDAAWHTEQRPDQPQPDAGIVQLCTLPGTCRMIGRCLAS